jgi:glycosyltransferase involved in cell wall biosynthesis
MGYGGIERHVLLLSAGLQARGHDVTYAGRADSLVANACSDAGVAVEPLRLAGLLDLPSLWMLRRLVQQRGFDILHAHGVRASHYVGWASAGLSNVRTVSTAHSTGVYRHMRRCDHVIAVSEAVRANLLHHGYRAQRLSVIHNGVPDAEVADRAAVRAELGIGDDEFAVFSAGRFIPDKGQDLMLDALARTRRPMRLFLAGDAGGDFGRSVRAAGVGQRVVFLGYRDDVPRLLSGFDAYLSASRREALGLSLIEAAAAGLPIVATAVGGVPEVVADGISGRLVASGDAAALAAALDHLVDHPAEATAQGRRGRERHLAHFTVEAMVGQTLDLYHRLREAP